MDEIKFYMKSKMISCAAIFEEYFLKFSRGKISKGFIPLKNEKRWYTDLCDVESNAMSESKNEKQNILKSIRRR